MQRPVFVVGCPRSGTTLLYSMMMAAGGFAAYRKETYFYDLLARFPDLSDPATRRKFTAEYLCGYLGNVPGMNVRPFVFAALDRCRTSAEFLPRLMDGIAKAQGMERWIEATPVHVLHMKVIKQAVPDAQFVHVIRDGRGCALSNVRKQWISTLPWDRGRTLGVAALQWEWMTGIGREFARANPADCFEVRFEDLIADPAHTLAQIGTIIGHDLDYARVTRNPVHALVVPNTSFREERHSRDFNPADRWRTHMCAADRMLCDTLIGPTLRELGYDSSPQSAPAAGPRARIMRAFYPNFYATKHFLKTRTPLGRLLTRTTVWNEQPRPGEPPLQPINPGDRLPGDAPMVAQ